MIIYFVSVVDAPMDAIEQEDVERLNPNKYVISNMNNKKQFLICY